MKYGPVTVTLTFNEATALVDRAAYGHKALLAADDATLAAFGGVTAMHAAEKGLAKLRRHARIVAARDGG